MEIGYWLASEEHQPKELVENARRAEEAGFTHLLVSDHIHPWVDAQGLGRTALPHRAFTVLALWPAGSTQGWCRTRG